MKKLTRLFEPLKVGTMVLKNRIALTGFAITTEEDTTMGGVLHRKYIDFFEERAKGGAGLLTLPDTAVDKDLRFQSHMCLGGDEFNPGMSALTEVVHAWGAKIAPDLHHPGSRYETDFHWFHNKGRDYRPLSPSTVSLWGSNPREMNTEDIEHVQELYADAALRAKVCRFDAVQLSGSYGYLLNQFMSPLFNKRTDKYGGSLENRLRFPVETVSKIKARIGNSLPVIMRLGATEYLEGGLTIDDVIVIARMLEEAGVDMLNVVAGIEMKGKYHLVLPPMGFPQGVIVDLGARIKEAVDIPVMIVGRITDPLFAEKILEEGKADMVGMARQLVSDPEWPVKAAEGRFSSIVPCIGCNECVTRLLEHRVSRCGVNAALGREREFIITPAPRPVKVMVIGGGPGGMEAARVAALRGHKVSLYEKDEKLGGQLIIASTPPYKDDLKQFQEYLAHQMKELGVEVKLGTEVTSAMVKKLAPDVVIVATGALPLMPKLPGIKGTNVVTSWEVLNGREVGGKVVIAGGGMVGCEVAEYLVNRKKNVTIVEMLPEIAIDLEASNRSALMERFSGYKLNIMTNSVVEGVNAKELVIRKDGKKKTVAADTVVIALGAVANDELAQELGRAAVKNLFAVGDCYQPGRIVDAVNQASYIARKI